MILTGEEILEDKDAACGEKASVILDLITVVL
jgi:hypothetical protein